MRVTFNEHNLSIIGAFVERNRKIFGAVQHSIANRVFLEHIRLSPISDRLASVGTVELYDCVGSSLV